MSLAEKSAVNAEKIVATAGPLLETLAGIAEQIKLPETARILREQSALLKTDTFRLIVLGRFRNGKSTFLNALLCELTHPVPELQSQGGGASGPLPAKDLPTTARLTTIDYGQTPAVVCVRKDGRKEAWSLARFMKEATIKRNPQENDSYFKDILLFQIRFPSKTLKSGITLLDSPGTDDIRERTEIVEQAVHRCDAAIVLLRSDALGGEDERTFIQSLKACGLNDLFFVINRREGRAVDTELREEAWNRIVAMALSGPWYAGQDPAERNISFVDAKAGLEGRLRRDPQKLAASGLEVFENRLSAFLEKEKRPAHIRRYVKAAEAHAGAVDESLQKLTATVKAKTEEFKTRFREIRPQIDAINRRVQTLPKIIDRYREKACFALESSFRQMIADLCRDLPTEMAKKKIPSVDDAGVLDRATLPFRKKTIIKETEAAAKAIYDARLSDWRDRGAQEALKKLQADLELEIVDELKGIKRSFDRIQHDLTGFQPDVESAAMAEEGWAKRVWIGVATVISPDYGYNMIVDGWGGMLRGLLIHTAVAYTVMTLGGPIGWAFLAGLITNLVVAAILAPDRLKAKFRQQLCDSMIPELRKLPDNVGTTIREKTVQVFAKIEASITAAVKAEVAKEEAVLQGQLDIAQKSAEEKTRLLDALQHHRTEVARCRKGLQDTMIAVESGRLQPNPTPPQPAKLGAGNR